MNRGKKGIERVNIKIEEHRRVKDSLVSLVMADDVGLYEAYWGLSDGEIYDPEFDCYKEISWEDLAKTVYKLVDRGFISVSFGKYKEKYRVNYKTEKILLNKINWEPFDMADGRGYFLAEGDETTARRLSGRSIRASFMG